MHFICLNGTNPWLLYIKVALALLYSHLVRGLKDLIINSQIISQLGGIHFLFETSVAKWSLVRMYTFPGKMK